MDIETLKTVGKVILGLLGMLLFCLPTGTVTKFFRWVRHGFRTQN